MAGERLSTISGLVQIFSTCTFSLRKCFIKYTDTEVYGYYAHARSPLDGTINEIQNCRTVRNQLVNFTNTWCRCLIGQTGVTSCTSDTYII